MRIAAAGLVTLFWLMAAVAPARAQGLRIAQAAPGLYVFTTWQDVNGTPFPANGVYVVADGGVAIIDAPWDTAQTRPLLDSIRRRHGKPVLMGLATHYHNDRTGSLGILKRMGIPTYASVHTNRLALERGEPTPAYTFRGDTAFRAGQLHLETFYPGGGHTADNLVVWFPKEKVLFGGCLVKSTESQGMGNVADAVVQEWPMAIENLRLRYPGRRLVIPGHQGWQGDPLAHTLALLKQHWKALNPGK